MSQPRVGIVVSHPIQHFCPLYRALAASGAIDLRVFFASDAGAKSYFDKDFGQAIRFQSDLLAGFNYEFLPGYVTDVKGKIDNPHVGERLSAFNPDVVQAYGYRYPLSRHAVRWARQAGRPVLLCSDSELRAPRRLWTKAMKALILPRFFAQCDGFLTIGDCNEDYYRNYGVDPSRFFRSPYPIDDMRLTEAVQSRHEARRVLIGKFALPSDATVALVVGKLTARKAVDQAIQAVARAWDSGLQHKLFLILAGNGPERERLEALAKSLQPEAVRFAGFVEVAELPGYYSAVDLLIHPSSQDPHPLAVSEAVFCGLPIIASDRIGNFGASDEVRVGMNGFEYKFGDVEALARHLVYMHQHPEERERMRQCSTEFGRQRALNVSVDGYLRAVHKVTGTHTSA
jgi:glycosyltransferase involved in cell wall biosynthesis